MAKRSNKRTNEPSAPENPRRSKRIRESPDKKVEQVEEEESIIDLEQEQDIENDDADASTFLADTRVKMVARRATREGSDLPKLLDEIPHQEALRKWPLRYQESNGNKGKKVSPESEDMKCVLAKAHYKKAVVDGVEYNLGDDAYINAEPGELDYIARVTEIFETIDGEPYFTAQWFFRMQDTIIKEGHLPEERNRVFISDETDVNPLDCICSKVTIVSVPPNLDLTEKKRNVPPCDLYYDMKYSPQCHTFSTIKNDTLENDTCSSSTISSDSGPNRNFDGGNGKAGEMLLLDLYSGCGAMSMGLCMGASIARVKLVNRWAVDMDEDACKSLKMNHPETEVRNMAAKDFLFLLKEWEKLCQIFCFENDDDQNSALSDLHEEEEDEEAEDIDKKDDEDFVVEKLLDMCYGDPNNKNECGLYFKVRWENYGEDEDTWEPLEGLSNCQEKVKEFVREGHRSNILPSPGNVDFICGGPPCQGISGFNRFRNKDRPLDDEKNHQLVVFMDIVDFLKPKYVLMENVVDIVKFAGGFLGRYALGRLVTMNYQARMGIMAAGFYGVPQFRNRVFLWGAYPSMPLPQFPLPTHNAVSRGVNPIEFQEVVVEHDKDQLCDLDDAVYLGDAIRDLPPVENDVTNNHVTTNEMNYGAKAESEFQKYIRLKKSEMIGFVVAADRPPKPPMLYDHVPLCLNVDDYTRVCRIPKRKGANFRDLPGLIVDADNRVHLDPSVPREFLPSKCPLVPEYAIRFVRGTSTKPFGRLWWDETVTTVVTRAEPHNQTVIHPEQDRVLTIRENARLQGFPDCYQFYGPVKKRYIQVGNAVAFPVAIALGYSIGITRCGLSTEKALFSLPFKFPRCLLQQSPETAEGNASD